MRGLGVSLVVMMFRSAKSFTIRSCTQLPVILTPFRCFVESSAAGKYAPKRTMSRLLVSNQERLFDPSTPLKINLLTIQQPELEIFLQSLGHAKYRAAQILQWVHAKGVDDFDQMVNIPKDLREALIQHTSLGSLQLEVERISKDGTRKRAYRLFDGQLIESVLMPYEDGRNTACISSQAGCAQACSFCATGQMGFARQLTSDEIFEQVAKFAAELRKQNQRLSNVVLMGMGEPLANYRNVMEAVRRMNSELGIGARKITISTVGIVPNIKKLMEEDIQVGLAISLHSANEDDRSLLLPANKRYGGLDTLMETIREYIDKTKRRVTFEWALIEGQNDQPEVARQLGRLLERHGIRKDMAHINLIPLNPTGGYKGSPSGRKSVEEFVRILEKDYRLSATPRVRRGIDIEAGCGQLKAVVQRKEKEDEEDTLSVSPIEKTESITVTYAEEKEEVEVEEEDALNEEESIWMGDNEAQRLINLVKGTVIVEPKERP